MGVDSGEFPQASNKQHSPSPYPASASVPRWTVAFTGRIYRPVMRLMHRLGWCYPQRTLVQPNMVWCHWCGMRGHTVPSAREMAAPGVSDRFGADQ